MTAGANRSKGAKSPDEWRPPDGSYWCEYAVVWITVKQTWHLTATPPEAEALEEMLGTCASPPRLTVRPADSPPAPAEPTSSPTAADTYADCDAKPGKRGKSVCREQMGPGRGFPQSKVPSARDGDRRWDSVRKVTTVEVLKLMDTAEFTESARGLSTTRSKHSFRQVNSMDWKRLLLDHAMAPVLPASEVVRAGEDSGLVEWVVWIRHRYRLGKT